MASGKFVIPNPFGPYEEPRFTAYLMKNLARRRNAGLLQPRLCPRQHSRLPAGEGLRPIRRSLFPVAPGFAKLNPSGYAESQGAFTLRVAREMRPRLDLPCPVELKKQTDFPEPRVRINTDIPAADALGWDESAAWDEFAAYYQQTGVGEVVSRRDGRLRQRLIGGRLVRPRAEPRAGEARGLTPSRKSVDELGGFGRGIVLLWRPAGHRAGPSLERLDRRVRAS